MAFIDIPVDQVSLSIDLTPLAEDGLLNPTLIETIQIIDDGTGSGDGVMPLSSSMLFDLISLVTIGTGLDDSLSDQDKIMIRHINALNYLILFSVITPEINCFIKTGYVILTF